MLFLSTILMLPSSLVINSNSHSVYFIIITETCHELFRSQLFEFIVFLTALLIIYFIIFILKILFIFDKGLLTFILSLK